ncbi:MAG: dihydroneopterin aldolase [Deltaproteobacteria bacterium]|nr:dihydroneopterin aldolase [Deltaproteobacteria bacterium]
MERAVDTPELGRCRRIFLRDYEVQMGLGVHAYEKVGAQRVRINVELFVPLAVSTPREDQLGEVVDYDFIRRVISERIARGHIQLQETLCDDLCARLLAHPRVHAVRVSTEKPDVYPDCDAIGVEVFRARPPGPDLRERLARCPRSAALLAFEREGPASRMERYARQDDRFFAEWERDLALVERAAAKPLGSCLEDLRAFNALPAETENDAWYERPEAMVSMHLDALCLGFSRRRLDRLVLQAALCTQGRPSRFLDVGSGCGRLAALLVTHNPTWEGLCVDRSACAAGYAEVYLQALGVGDRVRCVTGDLTALPVGDDSLDLAIAAEVLEHVTEPERGVQELVRALRPGGHLLVSLPLDLALGMHPTVFRSREDILGFLARFPLEPVEHQVVPVDPELDAIAGVFPGFEGCFHGTFRKREGV